MTSAAQQCFLRKSAWTFLLQYSIQELPVDVFALSRRMGVLVCDYAQAAMQTGRTEDQIRKHFDPDGFVVWSRTHQGFCIFYNQAAPEAVTRWTLMHELAHIYLGHIRRDVFYARTKKPFRQWAETEADGFTRRVLCPSIVLHEIQAFTPQKIALCCGVSLQAAEYRATFMRELERRKLFLLDPLERRVAAQFSNYIEKQKNQGLL